MNDIENPQQEQSLEEKLSAIQDKWTNRISELNEMFKNLASLDSLLNIIYSERQNLVDYYTNIMVTMAKLSKNYNQKYAEYYNKLKMGENGIRYTNESAINQQIDSMLAEYKNPIKFLNSHIEYIKESIKTFDNMIFGINHKIKILEMINGVKH